MTHLNQLLELPIGSVIVVHADPAFTGNPAREVFLLKITSDYPEGIRYWHGVESGLALNDDNMVAYLNGDGVLVERLGFTRLVDVEKTVDREALREIYDEAVNQGASSGAIGALAFSNLLNNLFDILDLDPTPATQAEVTSVETIITPTRKDSSA